VSDRRRDLAAETTVLSLSSDDARSGFPLNAGSMEEFVGWW
jgi:hypothetical protein